MALVGGVMTAAPLGIEVGTVCCCGGVRLGRWLLVMGNDFLTFGAAAGWSVALGWVGIGGLVGDLAPELGTLGCRGLPCCSMGAWCWGRA